ncbi:hypothetical protein ACH5RR_002201 [Cinchona calisaya]|uniref:BHLH domain-containing protein n=1 Tax=Cinchona calisaya TaxID=153742 RepID=A0ABD3B669_9GENT
MAGGGGNGGDGLENHGDPLSTGSYSQLLFADDVGDLDPDGCFNFMTSSFNSSDHNPPKMLSFGDYNGEEFDFVLDKFTEKFAQKNNAGVTCSDSSSASSTTNNSSTTIVSKTNNNVNNYLPKSNKRRNVSATETINNEPVQNDSEGTPVKGNQRNCKKKKSADNSPTDQTTMTGYAKVKKEKLGERVIALQQLVSPFGKTDTASVLHEAMGYIRFLQDQVQVLCSPYLQRLPSSAHLLEKGGENREGESRKDLRSKGLCLVPIELTLRVAETNGADFWSPAMTANFIMCLFPDEDSCKGNLSKYVHGTRKLWKKKESSVPVESTRLLKDESFSSIVEGIIMGRAYSGPSRRGSGH